MGHPLLNPGAMASAALPGSPTWVIAIPCIKSAAGPDVRVGMTFRCKLMGESRALAALRAGMEFSKAVAEPRLWNIGEMTIHREECPSAEDGSRGDPKPCNCSTPKENPS